MSRFMQRGRDQTSYSTLCFSDSSRRTSSDPLVAWNRHVETIFAAFFRSLPAVTFRRECLRTKDNGAVALDWVSADDRQLPFESPVLILLPGLTGGSDDTYVRHMLMRARNKGWRVVVFNSRGCANSPVTTPQGCLFEFRL
ncbi:embryogenesis-associated protein EMB8-like [Asparagus officinalis]|uniref:embryogenesis-associated protein EMB8-like n=1 Tax=Asparagus officinalis TaxID=4686 RepID=UPI00098E1420|nr:embryogenesis-associated protein EMB8-like [Asparagus officinalis]